MHVQQLETQARPLKRTEFRTTKEVTQIHPSASQHIAALTSSASQTFCSQNKALRSKFLAREDNTGAGFEKTFAEGQNQPPRNHIRLTGMVLEEKRGRLVEKNGIL